MENRVIEVDLSGLNVTQAALMLLICERCDNLDEAKAAGVKRHILKLAEFDKPPEGSA